MNHLDFPTDFSPGELVTIVNFEDTEGSEYLQWRGLTAVFVGYGGPATFRGRLCIIEQEGNRKKNSVVFDWRLVSLSSDKPSGFALWLRGVEQRFKPEAI